MADGRAPRSSSPGPPARGPQRPPPLLAAALLGFLVSLYALLNATLLFTAAQVDGLYAVFGAVFLGIAVLGIGGTVRALSGRGRRLLVTCGVVIAALAALGLVTSLADGAFSLWSALLVAAGVGIVVLLNRPASREFLASAAVTDGHSPGGPLRR